MCPRYFGFNCYLPIARLKQYFFKCCNVICLNLGLFLIAQHIVKSRKVNFFYYGKYFCKTDIFENNHTWYTLSNKKWVLHTFLFLANSNHSERTYNKSIEAPEEETSYWRSENWSNFSDKLSGQCIINTGIVLTWIEICLIGISFE